MCATLRFKYGMLALSLGVVGWSINYCERTNGMKPVKRPYPCESNVDRRSSKRTRQEQPQDHQVQGHYNRSRSRGNDRPHQFHAIRRDPARHRQPYANLRGSSGDNRLHATSMDQHWQPYANHCGIRENNWSHDATQWDQQPQQPLNTWGRPQDHQVQGHYSRSRSRGNDWPYNATQRDQSLLEQQVGCIDDIARDYCRLKKKNKNNKLDPFLIIGYARKSITALSDIEQSIQPRSLSNLANAFSKNVQDPTCKAAIVSIAKFITDQDKANQFKTYNPQDLSMLANAFAKIEKDKTCQEAMEIIAKCITDQDKDNKLEGYEAQHLSNLANAFSKIKQNDQNDLFQAAIATIARCILGSKKQLAVNYTAQSLSMLANAFSKVVHNLACQKAIETIAQFITDQDKANQFKTYNSQDLSLLANAFAKIEQNPTCQAAMVTIAEHILEQDKNKNKNKNKKLEAYAAQELSMLANAFAKIEKDETCQDAIVAIAKCISDQNKANKLKTYSYNLQNLANLANAFAKIEKDKTCKML